MAEAELARFIDRFTMEYVRVYPHPIERVWRAITVPEEFGVWFIPGRLDPRVGGAYWFGDDGFQGVVQAIEPPRLLRLSGDAGGSFQYELEATAGGTRMRFVNHVPSEGPYAEGPEDLGGNLPGGAGAPWRPGFVGGFHEMFDELSEFLDGVPIGSRLPPSAMSAFVQRWATHAAGTAQAFTEDQRALVVRSLRMRERWEELNRIYTAHIKATIPPAATRKGD